MLTLPVNAADKQTLDELFSSCSTASFGRGAEEVIDESYRKASKLDPIDFLTNFCPYKSGIIDVIAQLLLPTVQSEPRRVLADLYKLNVYSAPSGKFKAHVDTPRDAKQFGSLVVCLPVAHEGKTSSPRLRSGFNS